MPTTGAPVAFAGRHQSRARHGGVVGILDGHRDARLVDRLQRLLMKDGEAGVGQLAHLAIGDLAHRGRVLHQRGVGGEDGVHVGEILVEVGLHGAGEDGAGDVRAAAREGDDLPGAGIAEEAGKDQDARHIAQRGQLRVGFLQHARVPRLVGEHQAAVARIDVRGLMPEGTQVFGHQAGAIVLAGRFQGIQVARRDVSCPPAGTRVNSPRSPRWKRREGPVLPPSSDSAPAPARVRPRRTARAGAPAPRR